MQPRVLKASGACRPRKGVGTPSPLPTQQTDPAQSWGSRSGAGWRTVPEHQPWLCCWLGKSRSLVPKQQEESRHPLGSQTAPGQLREGRDLPWSHSKLGAEGTRIQAS